MKQRQKTGFFLLLALLATTVALANGEKAEQIDSLVSKYVELGQFNGTVLVAEDGKILHQGGYGLAQMEWNIANTPETKFRLGSITKQFTAMLVLQQVEAGEFGLEDTLLELLPYYREDTGSKITLHQLLNHTSGIPSYTGLPGFMADAARDPYDPETFVGEFCSGDLEFEPGSEFRYNNSGYFLLGAILEHAAGKSYTELLHEKILGPLGMSATGYDVSAEILDHRAAGYEKTPDGFRNADYLDMTIPYAAGSMYSTVGDLYLWDRALHAGKLLNEELTAKMYEPGMANYAYGWMVMQRPVGTDGAERRVIGHGGGINGFNTLIERVADDEHLVVLLNNTGRAPLGPLSGGILDILYGREPEPPSKPLIETLTGAYMESGVEAAIAKYREIAENDPDAVRNGEQVLNVCGYQLMGAGEIEAALALFRFNVEQFPESFNVHDSLGEALAAAGETEEAIKSYARSLELNPGNRNAVEWLSKLTAPQE